MRSIVVPVNFTASSANAARYAADLALVIGAEIHLLYALQVPITASEVPMPDYIFEEMQENGVELLQGLTNDLLKHTFGKVSVTSDMKIGDVDYQIREYCNSSEPFMIVMGASGHSFSNMIEGSHTARALHHLNTPVLVVPENTSFKPVRKMVMACDREDISYAIPANLPFLKILTRLFSVSIEVLHVITGDDDSAFDAGEQYNHWKNELEACQPQLHIIRQPDVEESVKQYAEHAHADWIIFFPKKHGLLSFHRSKTGHITSSGPIPILSLRQ